MPNLELTPKKHMSSMRKISMGTWKTVGDPSVYGAMDIDVTDTVRYIAEFREKTGRHLTLSHMMCKVMGAVYTEMPDANAILRLGKIYERKRIGAFFQVALEDKETGEMDLSGATVMDPEKKNLIEIMDDFDSKVRKVRRGEDKELEKSRSLFKRMPNWVVRYVLNLVSFLCYTLNLDMRWAGLPQDAFGSMMITNVGSLGLQEAYVPLVPYSRVPLLLALGKVADRPAVKNGEIVIIKNLHLSVTFDHRILDGMHAAKMSKVVTKWLENPYEHFMSIEDAVAVKGLESGDAKTSEKVEKEKEAQAS